MGPIVTVAVYAVCVLAVLFLVLDSVFIVRQQSRAIVERLGRYNRTADPGLQFKIPLVERRVRTMQMRMRQLNVTVETKTKDNVFVKVFVSVQYRVVEARASDAFYMLRDEEEQITSYVLDVVRAKVPTMDLDHVFERKDEIADAVKDQIGETMSGYGWDIAKALVTDIDPDAHVKEAMNEIQAQQRLQVAATAKGEANKILVVKNAEAEAESKRLQGEGIAKQRRAIIDGLSASVEAFASKIQGVEAKDVLQLVLLTQYFDTIKDIGVSSGSKVILIPHSPGGMADLANQLRAAIVTAEEATRP